jgi:hypothetical protein
MEAKTPSPLILIDGHARSDADRQFAHRHSRRASILRGLQDSGGGLGRALPIETQAQTGGKLTFREWKDSSNSRFVHSSTYFCVGASVGSSLTMKCKMPTIEQCRACAGEYKILARDQKISGRRSAVLLGISRSWTALAHQLENLTAIIKEEGK